MSNAVAIGLDGCAGCWVMVTIEQGKAPTLSAIRNIESLANVSFKNIAIDIPIGLPDEDKDRCCDRAARQYLGENRSRVFLGIRREFLNFLNEDRPDYAAANCKLFRNNQRKMSKQLWYILPKIKEVDAYLRADATLRTRMRETHPELVFKRLSGKSLPAKKGREGVLARQSLLVSCFNDISSWLGAESRRALTDKLERRYMSVKPDDILDACACALAAQHFEKSCVLPESESETDAHKLPMRIWF